MKDTYASRKPISRTALMLLPFQAIRAGEALLPVLLAAWFGTTSATDTYYLSLAYFSLVGSLVFGIFKDSVLVPLLTELRVRAPADEPAVVGSFLAHTLVYGSLLSMLVGFLGWALAYVHFAGQSEPLSLAQQMLLPFCLWLVALSIKTFFGALLNAHYRFFAAPMAAGLGVATTVGAIALFRQAMGVAAIPWGLLLGELVGVGLLVWIALGLAKMRLPLSMKRSENVRQFVLLALPDVVGGAVTRVNPIVDQTMAATVGLAGAGTLLKQALDTADFPTSILQSALLPILLTHLSDDVARGNALQFRQTVLRSLASVCAMLAALAGVLYWARVPLVRLVFLHGAMDPVAIHHLTSLLPYALLGLPPMGALMVLARAHIALKNTKLMFPLGVLNAGLHVGLNALFVRWVGLGGLALSSACVNVVIALLFWWKLEELLGSQRSFVFEHASGEPPSR